MLKRLASWNPIRGVWETEAHDLLSELSEPFSATWPSSGMTRGGVAFELPMPALPTPDSASSSLPTPLASDGERQSLVYARGNPTLRGAVQSFRGTPRTSSANGPGQHETSERGTRGRLESRVDLLLKTPTSQLAVNGGSQHPVKRREGGHGPTLADEVEHLLPTPQVADVTGGHKTRSGARSGELLLPGVVEQLLPTPAAHDSGGSPEAHLSKKPGREVVTSLQVLVDHDLLSSGGRIAPPSSGGSTSPVGEPPTLLDPTDETADTD